MMRIKSYSSSPARRSLPAFGGAAGDQGLGAGGSSFSSSAVRFVRKSAARPRAGFTLIEVLASLMLIAIVLPVALAGISLASSAASLARQQTEAANLAQTKMAELLATNAWQTGSLSGDFSPDWPAYRWTGQVSEYEGATLQQLQVSVNWTARGKDYIVSLATLVYTGSQ